LQYDSALKEKFAAGGLNAFYRYILPGYSILTALASKVLCMFGSTYLCEQVFLCSEHQYNKAVFKAYKQALWHPEIGCLSGWDAWYRCTFESQGYL